MAMDALGIGKFLVRGDEYLKEVHRFLWTIRNCLETLPRSMPRMHGA